MDFICSFYSNLVVTEKVLGFVAPNSKGFCLDTAQSVQLRFLILHARNWTPR